MGKLRKRSRTGLSGFLVGYLSRLRFPYLFLTTALLFVGDLFWPDVIPLADELLLGLLAALFGSWRKDRRERRAAKKSPELSARPRAGPEAGRRPPDTEG